MSDEPDDTQAETAVNEPVQPAPAPVAPAPTAPAAAAAPATPAHHSNGRIIFAAIAGAVIVLVIALAGVVGYAIGSHHNGGPRGDFPGAGQRFERHGMGQQGQGFGPPGMGWGQQGQGQLPSQGQQGSGSTGQGPGQGYGQDRDFGPGMMGGFQGRMQAPNGQVPGGMMGQPSQQ